MNSRISNEVEQGALLLGRANPPETAPIEAIAKCKTLMSAINLMFNLSGLEDKEIYSALNIDAGHFSNIRKAKPGHHFPVDKLDDAMTLCSSDIPLIWQALKRGKGLVILETEAARQLRLVREENAKLRERLEYAETFIRGK